MVVSLCSSILTAAMIVSRKLYNHPFAFLIMTIQLCYATMAILDLLSKAFTSDDLWCRVVTPVIYGMITVLLSPSSPPSSSWRSSAS